MVNSTVKPVRSAIESAQRTIAIELQAVAALQQRIDDRFAKAVALLAAVEGRVIVSGMGKSGHIGSKIAATLASTGTPAQFVHPAEACHGDMGMITRSDAALLMSNSGTTSEITALLPLLKRLGIPIVAMTGSDESTLARAADVHLNIGVEEEACPLDLAPTASTTANLVMGDALAIALLEQGGFTAEDFAFTHPGGTLGRRLLTRVADVLVEGDNVPKITKDTSLADALMEISAKGLGMSTVVDDDDHLLGIFTDGDLRRALEQRHDLNSTQVGTVMSTGAKTINTDALAAEAVTRMENERISALVVLDSKQCVIGVVQLLALLRAGIV
ncbi:MAG: KpsF/GutQ family sugar-phosphate isomerase [Luminiphilus sp.]|jgi:arabinose-5-phosphate isomerase|nr:KpsF/GutQ family sugar-phosphate isomerase [Pseudomonadales bacterium]MBL6901534.1 KpsF/GutQ family sugar-phosphate isomerase [Luminiphilus sp.]MDA0890804.1 KpsF/GutQ family sugar-phosphate isomerase [Pseudomonadota bacterium]